MFLLPAWMGLQVPLKPLKVYNAPYKIEQLREERFIAH